MYGCGHVATNFIYIGQGYFIASRVNEVHYKRWTAVPQRTIINFNETKIPKSGASFSGVVDVLYLSSTQPNKWKTTYFVWNLSMMYIYFVFIRLNWYLNKSYFSHIGNAKWRGKRPSASPYTLPANCVKSPYPMAATTHRININLNMHHCVANCCFVLLTNTKED